MSKTIRRRNGDSYPAVDSWLETHEHQWATIFKLIGGRPTYTFIPRFGRVSVEYLLASHQMIHKRLMAIYHSDNHLPQNVPPSYRRACNRRFRSLSKRETRAAVFKGYETPTPNFQDAAYRYF